MATDVMDVDEVTPALKPSGKAQRPSALVEKPIPYTFDLGNLLVNDSNPLSSDPSQDEIRSVARDCAQSLINQLLTTCRIHTDKTHGALITLPEPITPLPREKPLPTPKAETKWERFARKKGITDKKRGEGKMVYDEEKGDWVQKWGYKGKNKGGEDDWLVEVDEKKEREMGEGRSIRQEGRRERMEKIRRNERSKRANERRARKGGMSSS